MTKNADYTKNFNACKRALQQITVAYIKRAYMHEHDMTKPMKKTINFLIKPQKSGNHLHAARGAKFQTPNISRHCQCPMLQ